ncbi:mevalonate kinase [Heterostelium album PN500]|uniref:Mevalonate kinase n=1 Tax=Heterostelium pallidum (strain ATCC 26659 / Pp 5 / PN500) TaxID=670386 RepID=D3B2F2_HETP5|nr:mevalonate kinase [Heterostelium album PN500]EFA84527.1 mevalonate kinase [Heterostelium album PN500]|eukprot:XP_020436640.1 mevalonate kinase [Heterostelium album PN500]
MWLVWFVFNSSLSFNLIFQVGILDFCKIFYSMKQIKVSAPGKVILFGEHAVVLGKTSIATALSLRTNATVEQIEEPVLHILLPDLKDFGERKYSLSDLSKLNSYNSINEIDCFVPRECNAEFLDALSQLESIKGIQSVLFLFSVLSKLKHGIKIHFSSNLPMGAGLGSSASFNVCLVTGILSLFEIYACGGCDQCKKINSSSGTTNNVPCSKQLELINQWSLQGEKIMHGTPSGIDNAVSTYGSALTFTRKDGFKNLERIPPLRLLITDTRVSRSTKVLVENVINRHKQYPSLIEPVAVLIDTISKECLQAFDQYFNDHNDINQLQKTIELMIDMNHSLLSGCFGVGHSTLDMIASVSKRFDLHSKLTGAGGGGCAITLLKPSTDSETVNNLKSALKEHGFESWEATIGGQGVIIESSTNSSN